MPLETRSRDELIAEIHRLEDAIGRFEHEDRNKVEKLNAMEVLVGGIAHDFNNILCGILGNISLARMQLEPCHGAALRLEESEKAAVRAGELARKLLAFNFGGELAAKKRIALPPLIRDVALFILHSSRIERVVDVADGLWPVEADGGQIGQALSNLLINAVQAMPEGGRVAVRAANLHLEYGKPYRLPPGDYVWLAVEDEGSGIPPEDLQKIFDPYFTTKPSGTGLGLPSVLSIVKKHGGAVEVSSTVGVGSRFEIVLPAASGGVSPGLGE
ncbi:sensor histidine kinase [Geobacter sp. FeAm09]|uniref:sensor histidine kinase n=1 Tax=Geobacter sp. FeAm09 TaxID=2597769 RepID=UPI00143CEF08|nr:ATP-binding protein [Geobacter sp. FeAm09]